MRQAPGHTRQEILDAALRYSRAGWAVLPLYGTAGQQCSCRRANCPSPGKHPTLKGGVHAATRDEAKIHRFFSSEISRNLGIATGLASGIFVLDVDPRHGGDASLSNLEAAMGPLPQATAVLSRGDGRHIYLRHPSYPIANSAGLLGKGLDVRGDGGYIVAPPSTHVSGKHYAWLAGGDTLAASLVPAPAALLEAIARLKAASAPNPRPHVRAGERNITLMSLAGSQRRRGAAHAEIVTYLMKQNDSLCEPPLDQDEILSTANSVIRYAPAKHAREKTSTSMAMVDKMAQTEPHTKKAENPEGDVHNHRAERSSKKSSIIQENELWRESVMAASILEQMVEICRKHIILPPQLLHTIALWILFTHVHDAFKTSPILGLVSPDRRCGKTATLTMLRFLVRRPLAASNITPAALFRAVDQWQPTLLIDEADTFLQGNDEIRGIINSGHQRHMAAVIRSLEDNHEPHAFSTWCPKAIAKIGLLSDTLADRAILIPMRRKKTSEFCDKLTPETEKLLQVMASKAARWAVDNIDALALLTPNLPRQLNDRAKDNWKPLLAIAELAGDKWPGEAQAAAMYLAAIADPEDLETPATLLLQDIYDAFVSSGANRLQSSILAATLAKMEHRPWPEWHHNRPITPRQIAQLWRPFGIAPKSIRFGHEGTPKGYERIQFEDVWEHYLSSPPAKRDVSEHQGIAADVLSPRLQEDIPGPNLGINDEL